MRLLALEDRNPDFLTHREIDATLKLLPADVDCRWVATDDPRARELASYDGEYPFFLATHFSPRSAAARAASCIRFPPPGYGRQPRDVP